MTQTIRTEFLGRLEMTVTSRHALGDTPWGGRRIDFLGQGRFAGPELDAEVVDGIDHMLRLADGTMVPDVKVVLRSAQGELVYLTYRGFLYGDGEQMARAWRGETADASTFTLRSAANFETGAPRLAWLNHVIGIGLGERIVLPDGRRGIRFDIYRVL